MDIQKNIQLLGLNQQISQFKEDGLCQIKSTSKKFEVLDAFSINELVQQEFKRNNITIKEELEDGTSIAMTFKRGGIIDDNASHKEEENFNDIDIQINLSLHHVHLTDIDLITVQKYLKKQKIQLKSYLASGGEADVYDGYIINKSGHKEEKAFRIIKASSKIHKQELFEEYQKISTIQQSKYIIQYDCMIQIGDIFIFLMEKFGGSLQKIKNQVDSNEMFFQIFYDLIQCLIELRIYNIIHSDLKPSNILFNGKYFCLCDFGMALKLRRSDKSTLEKKGFTLKYCAPEYQRGFLSYLSDMYSLGVIIIEISQNLIDQSLKQKIEEFVTKNLLQKLPENRIDIYEFLPLFVIKVQNQLDSLITIGNLFKITQYFQKYIISSTVDLTQFYKIFTSLHIANNLAQYIACGLSSFCSYKSLSDFEFEIFCDGNVYNLIQINSNTNNDDLSLMKRKSRVQKIIQYLESTESFDNNEDENKKNEKIMINQLTLFLQPNKTDDNNINAKLINQIHEYLKAKALNITPKEMQKSSKLIVNEILQSLHRRKMMNTAFEIKQQYKEEAYSLFGEICFYQESYDESIEASEYAIKLLQQYENSQNQQKILLIYENLAIIYIRQNKLEEACKSLKLQIHELKKQGNEIEQIQLLSKIVEVEEMKNNKEEALFYLQQIVEIWKESFDKNQPDSFKNTLIKGETLIIVENSFFKLKEYFQFVQQSLEVLRFIHQYDIFNNHKSKYLIKLKDAINRLGNKERLRILDEIINDQNNDFPLMELLFEFASWYYYESEYQQMFIIVNKINADKYIFQQFSLKQQLIQLLMYAKYYEDISNRDEAYKHLQEFCDLHDKVKCYIDKDLREATVQASHGTISSELKYNKILTQAICLQMESKEVPLRQLLDKCILQSMEQEEKKKNRIVTDQ